MSKSDFPSSLKPFEFDQKLFDPSNFPDFDKIFGEDGGNFSSSSTATTNPDGSVTTKNTYTDRDGKVTSTSTTEFLGDDKN